MKKLPINIPYLFAVILLVVAVVMLSVSGGSKPGIVAIELNADGCNPGGLAISTEETILRVTNHSDINRFTIFNEDGEPVTTSVRIHWGSSKDVRVTLPAGYYSMECGGPEALVQLTVGTPGGVPVDLGSSRASISIKKDAGNRFVNAVLVANKASYKPLVVDPDLANAWGLANRPAGAGGHFWVTSTNTGNSLEYVGDVGETPFYQDDLRVISVPGTTDLTRGAPPSAQKLGLPTGVVFNPSNTNFVVDQGAIAGPAKFIFCGQDGTISAWTEQVNANGTKTQLAWATKVVDEFLVGSQFFGLAIAPAGDTLLVADFGLEPQIRTFDSSFKPIETAGFANPFVKPGEKLKPGSLVPWNITTVGDAVYVSYAALGEDDDGAGVAAVAEENHEAGAGRVVKFNADGSLAYILNDKGSLNAPWGLTVAPKGFGRLAGDLLVANFGDGSISAFKPDGTFDDWVRKADGSLLVNPGIWAVLPGNGASLGAADSVYYTAGPNAERDGVFGRIRSE